MQAEFSLGELGLNVYHGMARSGQNVGARCSAPPAQTSKPNGSGESLSILSSLSHAPIRFHAEMGKPFPAPCACVVSAQGFLHN